MECRWTTKDCIDYNVAAAEKFPAQSVQFIHPPGPEVTFMEQRNDVPNSEAFWEATIELDRWMTTNMHCEKYEYDPIRALREISPEGLCELQKRIDAAFRTMTK